MYIPNILGISGSLRNARFGRGSDILLSELKQIKSKNSLIKFLESQTKIRISDILLSKKKENQPFDETYRALQKLKGDKGLSNSEASLAAGLWGAYQNGCNISHTGLSTFFPMNGAPRRLNELRKKILSADAILISGPVYFGDRGSLVHEFIEYIRSDKKLSDHCKGKAYAGITVGAKRNGGQETTLIYQIVDMSNLNMLVVGNSAETTSQYGGTVLAGDVGTAWQDEYGINTSIGTGARLAKIQKSLSNTKNLKLKNSIKIGILVVQDSNDFKAIKYAEKFIKKTSVSNVDFEVLNIANQNIARCIACDLCPTHHAPAEEYACIIKNSDDFFFNNHKKLVSYDAILLMGYSGIIREKENSVYQRFIERTRYWRRSSYMIGDKLTAPFVISELNSNQNLHIRMLTSLIRHHTIIHHPITAFEKNNTLLNSEYAQEQFDNFSRDAIKTSIAKLSFSESELKSEYNPIGYLISKERDNIDKKVGKINYVFKQKKRKIILDKKRLSFK